MQWLESTRTTHASLREAVSAALDRTVHVDEDTGSIPAVSIPRVEWQWWGQGVQTGLIAETLALAQLPARRSARAWELTAHHSLDSRRHAGFLRERWDLIEELWPTVAPAAVLHVLGPWSLGVSVEYKGHPVFGDRPAFKDMALTLGEVIAAEAKNLGKVVLGDKVPVQIVIHEPRLAEVLHGVAGVTQFDGYTPVDRSIVWGVWHRLADQLAGSVSTLSINASIKAGDHSGTSAVLTMLGENGSDDAPVAIRPIVPVGMARGGNQDVLAALLDRGQPIIWELSDGTVAGGTGSLADIEQRASTAAKEILEGWRRWMLPADSLTELVGIGMPEAVRSPAAASTAAAVARTTAALLWRN